MCRNRFFLRNVAMIASLAVTSMMFSGCDKKEDPKEEQTPSDTNNQNDPNKQSGSLTSDNGVIIGGVKWATHNVDKPGTFTAKPEDPGLFYQWNGKVGWSTTDPLIPSDGKSTWDKNWNGNNATTWEKVNNPCPAGWRVPTESEIKSLLDTTKVTNTWATVNGTTGKIFTDKANKNSIFLLAAYCRSSDGTLCSIGSFGNSFTGSFGIYWSSTAKSVDVGYFTFDKDNARFTGKNLHSFGFCVRPVADN